MNKNFSIQRHKVFASLIFLVGFVFTSALTYQFWEAQEEAEIHIHNEEADLVVSAVKRQLERVVELLHGGIGLFAASEFVDRGEWASFFRAQEQFGVIDGIRAFEYVVSVPHENKEEFLEEVRSEVGYEEFAIRPDDVAEVHYVVTYVEPKEGNEAVFGLDLGFNEERLAMLERARDTGMVAMSEPIQLIQATSTNGLLFALPVYTNGMATNSIAERREALQGFVLGVVEFSLLLNPVDFNELIENIGFDLRVQGSDFEESFFSYRGREQEFEDIVEPRVLEFGGVTFEVHAFAFNKGAEVDEHLTSYILFVGGTLLAALIALIVFLIGRSRESAVQLAEKMTIDLRAANKHNIVERKRAEEALLYSEKAKKDLEIKTAELEELSSQMVGREVKMVELKEKLKKYEAGE